MGRDTALDRRYKNDPNTHHTTAVSKGGCQLLATLTKYPTPAVLHSGRQLLAAANVGTPTVVLHGGRLFAPASIHQSTRIEHPQQGRLAHYGQEASALSEHFTFFHWRRGRRPFQRCRELDRRRV